jgi:acyl carrier protein
MALPLGERVVTLSPNGLKLQQLLMEILLIEESEYRDENGPDEIGTWDSLAMVGIAAGVEKEFGYAMTPEEMVALGSIGDIKALLRRRQISID